MACKIKICGLTNREDMEFIAKTGADYGGVLVEIEQSPRSNTLDHALEICSNPPVPIAAVTLDKSVADNLRIAEALPAAALQLHGHESPRAVEEIKQQVTCEVWKALHIPVGESAVTVSAESLIQHIIEYKNAGADRIVFDASAIVQGKRMLGGTGQTVDWDLACEVRNQALLPILLAGGLNPDNAVQAFITVQPYGLDVASGVELCKGKKDPDKVLALIARIREYERNVRTSTSGQIC